jgi:hypothetical protein
MHSASFAALFRANPSMETLLAVCKKIERLSYTIPGYKWMTVVPQLTSRICHQQENVTTLLAVRTILCC